MSTLSVVCDNPKVDQFVLLELGVELPSLTVSADDDNCTADALQSDRAQDAELPFAAITPYLYEEPHESAGAVSSEPICVRTRCYNPHPGRYLPRDPQPDK